MCSVVVVLISNSVLSVQTRFFIRMPRLTLNSSPRRSCKLPRSASGSSAATRDSLSPPYIGHRSRASLRIWQHSEVIDAPSKAGGTAGGVKCNRGLFRLHSALPAQVSRCLCRSNNAVAIEIEALKPGSRNCFEKSPRLMRSTEHSNPDRLMNEIAACHIKG